MKFTTIASLALALCCAATVQAQDHFSGRSYDVTIVRDGVPVDGPACMTFHDGGRFTLDVEPLTMRWAPMTHYPDLFLAVTSPGHRTVVPYHMAAFGERLADRSIVGSGVYQDGSTFRFKGVPRERCASEPQQQAGAGAAASLPSAVSAPDRDALRFDDALRRVMSRRFEPCWTPPGYQVPCDPLPDPLEADDGPVDRSPLAGKSFRLTVGSADGKVFDHCWTFGPGFGIDGAGLRKTTWRADPADSSAPHFVAVGGTEDGEGLAYHGVLIGENLLHVAGIVAFNGAAVVTEGYGQRVAHCDVR